MKVIWFDTPGSPEVLYVSERPDPELHAGHVRVQIKAAALNRADLLQRRGLYPPPVGESAVLGLEIAGEVLECASDVSDFMIGDRVCALLPGGGYAEQAVVPIGMLAKMPDNLSFEQAAAIPEAFLTAYSNLVWLGQLHSGYKVLIHAGASGVGTAAIQLVRVLGGQAIVTAGTEQKRDACLKLGAEAAIDYHDGPFQQKVWEFSGEHGVNIILDFVGAPYLEQNMRCLAVDGRLIVVGTMGGAKGVPIDLGLLLARRLHVIGTALRSRTLSQKIILTKEFWTVAREYFASGALKPVVDSIFTMQDATAAHHYMESNQNIGKIILRWD